MKTLGPFCLDNYGLDCAYYYSLPSYTFSAMLKYTKIELELISNYDMYLFIEKGVRGGITSCVKRHACANNHYLNESYNPNDESSYIIYLDSNNLYGMAMSKPMPYSSFEWMSKKEIKSFNVEQISETSSIGYICEVDLEYPQHLHDDHNDLPLCPENKCPLTQSKESS